MIEIIRNLYNRLSTWMRDKIFYHFKYLDNNMSFFLSSFLSLNTKVNLNDGKTVVVVAHSDDEVLWFEPLLANAKAIVFLGGSYGQTRYNFLTNIYGTNGVYNKNIPKYYAFDIITDQRWTDEALHDSCYRDNALYTYQNLYDHARPILEQLKSQGMKRVVTHNPWGEYGHPHHRKISDVIRDIGANDLGFDVWYNDVIKLNIDAPGEYYKSWFLDKVLYTKTYIFNNTVINTVRTGMINTTINAINPNNGTEWNDDLWTWDHDPNGYPTGERKFWNAVIKKQDLIEKYPTLNEQISKIKAEIPYELDDPNAAYVIEPIYDCSYWPDYLDDGFTVVVVAHADDEILWFESILKRAMAIVYLGTPLSVTKYNFVKNVYENNTIYDNPTEVISAYTPISDAQWITLAYGDVCNRDSIYSYNSMYDAIKPVLVNLKAQGMKRVVTHNPWGEYGHPHHRRISDVIRDMAVNDPDVNFDVWYNDVAAIERVPVLTDSDYFYYTTWFLDNVTYTRSQYFNYNKYYQIKTDMQNTYITGVNPNNGQPLTADLWTWIDKKYDYPTGERKYWCAVDNGVDLIATNSTLATQISKIKGEIPYQTGEQYSEYLVLPSYSC